ncbi:MAG: FtsX-like permease family protein [Candidatus Heimdallarchaeota archaeon]|nr:FtsX-like permease family protein [Candidatus Heimdallarchaeota archaeon]
MFTLKIAFRFIFSKKSQSLLILIGFAIGIAVNIFVGSIIRGVESNLINTTIGASPHITITPIENQTYIEGWEDILNVINKNKDLKVVLPVLEERVFITNINPESPDDVIIRGMELDKGNEIYNYYDSDRFYGNPPNSINEVIIGKELAIDLEVNISDTITLQKNPNSEEQGTNLIISGIFDLGVSGLNSIWLLSEFNIANQILNTSSQINGIYIQVNDIFLADVIADEIELTLNNQNIMITNWKKENTQLLTALNAQEQSSSIIQFFVLMSVVIAIASVLSITVIQKSKQIGILKAMGLTNQMSARVFLFQGLLYSFFGTLLGLALGSILVELFNRYSNVPFQSTLHGDLIIITTIAAILFSVIASLIPAKNSSKMEIIDIIRNY